MPSVHADGVMATNQPPPDNGPELQPLKILVVEDDREIREMVALMVRGIGYAVSTANTGREALARLRESTHDIVLLDLMMPEMDGFELCRVVREDPTLGDLHIIITSARDALEDKVKGLELGAADYLTKPFSMPELQARIKVGERLVRYQKTLKDQKAQLEHLAREDVLTGLANRRRFEERAREECLRAQRYQHPLSILLGDLDHFKSLNDQYGHAFGDTVLKEVGGVLLSHCRTSDLVARYGGEEFAILLPETDTAEARKVAERLCAAVRTLAFTHAGRTIRVSVSFGYTSFTHHAPQTLAELLDQADQALYVAKRKGRDRAEDYQSIRRH